MTAATLRAHTAKDLAQMARDRGIAGWHSMRKEELIRALVRAARKRSQAAARSEAPASRNGSARPQAKVRRDRPAALAAPRNREIAKLRDRVAMAKNLSANQSNSDGEDRLVVMVRDPYWLHAYWELNQRSIDRAQAALGQRWHGSRPVLRVFRLGDDGTGEVERDITIHGGVRNWYVDVQNPPAQYRMEIGYAAEDGVFFCLARSNTVSTPAANGAEAVDGNWADVAENADRIFAMSGGYSPHGVSRELRELMEERLQRPLGNPMQTRYGSGAAAGGEQMQFAVDADVIVYGAASRNSHVTMQGEPVPLRDDGTFAVRLPMPDRRQVIPVVASSSDGVEQRTIILAVERNTKTMEPVVRDVTDRS
ncbi:MAG: DUF4912 domain-containing protein [Planctomycetaceae bacterium]|nr:DUF4912 domain-containing protein [Planctomycetaceae bacterium]